MLIDQVKRTKTLTQPNVKMSIVSDERDLKVNVISLHLTAIGDSLKTNQVGAPPLKP